MKRVLIAAGMMLGLLAGAVSAQSVKLTGDEIRALLTGNTAIGRWEGTKYRQFFGADGVTIFAQEGARSARGEWRVDDPEIGPSVAFERNKDRQLLVLVEDLKRRVVLITESLQQVRVEATRG